MSRERFFFFILLGCLATGGGRAWGQPAEWLRNMQKQSRILTDTSRLARKCAFPLFLEARSGNNPELQKIAVNFRRENRAKTQLTYRTPSGNFVISYDTSGVQAVPDYDRNGNGLPDYVEFLATALDRAWQVEVDSLGFNPPPDINNNPHTPYPVELLNLPRYTYGFTALEDTIPGPQRRYVSSISITTDFAWINENLYAHANPNNDPVVRDSLALAVTAAHEFNHALQLGYNFWQNDAGQFEDIWFIENSATYMEEVVADEVNDYYQYLDTFFSQTDRPLATPNQEARIYGQAAFNIMLGELYGKAITREIWQELPNRRLLSAFDMVIGNHNAGSSLESELLRLAAWIFFTGDHSVPGQFFPEATDYPRPPARRSLVGLAGTSVDGSLPALAFRYQSINLEEGGDLGAFLRADSLGGFLQASYFVDNSPFQVSFPANASTIIPLDTPYQLPLAVFSGNWKSSAAELDYQLRLQIVAQNSGARASVYPVVVRPDQPAQQISFFNLPEEGRVEIFSSSGIHLATLRPAGGSNSVFWDLRTDQGNPVASGVYIYRVVGKKNSSTGKVMIIR